MTKLWIFFDQEGTPLVTSEDPSSLLPPEILLGKQEATITSLVPATFAVGQLNALMAQAAALAGRGFIEVTITPPPAGAAAQMLGG